MKTRTTLRKITEPFAYLVLVAAFGFITTVVNQTQRDEKSIDSEFVTLNLEHEFTALFTEEQNQVDL